MPAVELAIVPAGIPGLWRAYYGVAVATAATYQPIYEGARELLALGIPPKQVVRIRHRGNVALAAEVGELAVGFRAVGRRPAA